MEIQASKEASPWPSKGVLWWAGFVAFSVITQTISITSSTRGGGLVPLRLVLGILGVGIAVAVCAWWYGVSKRHRRRKQLLRIPGYLLFGHGTMLSGVGCLAAELPVLAELRSGASTGIAVLAAGRALLLLLAVSGGILVAAYCLVFRANEKTA